MNPNPTISRRALLAGLAALPVVASHTSAFAAESLPLMTVTKDPSCGCCGAWVDHVRAARFPVEAIESPEVTRLKVRLGVPRDLASCHTAEVGGYVIEGHVPADAIRRLLPRLAGRRLKDSLRVRPYPTGSADPIPGRGNARCATLDVPVTVRDRCRTFRDAE